MVCDETCDILIVGAGLAGASTAFHLAQAGAGGVVLVEKEFDPGVHSSGRNAAMVRACVEDADVAPFAKRGAKALLTGAYCEYRKSGSLLIGMGDDSVADYFPLADGKGLWCPDDGVVDPAGLLRTFLRGQRVLCNTRVIDWKSVDGGFLVRTNSGTLRTRILVNAAGPWAGVVGDLPLQARNRHLYLTPPMNGVERSMPFVWDVVSGLYFRPEGGGLLLCPCDESQRDPGDYLVDDGVETELAIKLQQHQPRLAGIQIKTRWTGQRVFAKDQKFVVGFDARHSGLFHVAALGGHGVTVSDAIGRFAADMILNATTDSQHPFSPARLVSPLKMGQSPSVAGSA